jgi:hypothetical protein
MDSMKPAAATPAAQNRTGSPNFDMGKMRLLSPEQSLDTSRVDTATVYSLPGLATNRRPVNPACRAKPGPV